MFAYQFTVSDSTANIHESPKFSPLCLVVPDISEESISKGLEEVSRKDGFIIKCNEEFLAGAINATYKNTNGVGRSYHCPLRLTPPSPVFICEQD